MLRLVATVAVGAALFASAGDAARTYVLAVEGTDARITLSRVDPLTLTRIGRPIMLGELHAGRAVSPDRSRVALGISAPGRTARVGVRVIDLRRWKVLANIGAGIAVEALWWPSARRVVCVLNRNGFVVADPVTGKVVKRVMLPVAANLSLQTHGAAVTPHGLAVLLDDRDAAGPAPPTVAVASVGGTVRTVTVDRILKGHGNDATLTAAGDRAVVLGGGLAAEIDLGTLAVTYHDVAAPAAGARRVNAVDVGGGVVAVSGVRADGSPSGLDLLDTPAWQTRHLEDDAASIALAGGTILAWREKAPGVRGYGRDGTRAFAILDDSEIKGVVVAGSTAYVQTGTATVIVDAASGMIVRRIEPPRPLVAVVDLHSGA